MSNLTVSPGDLGAAIGLVAEAVEVRAQPIDKRIVLLVEDNSADVFLVKQAIEFHQVPVHLVVAEDGQEAWDYFERVETTPDRPCPDVLLLDLNLPKKSGTEVLEGLQKCVKCRDMPVVVITSSDAASDRQRAASLGASRYFRKPPSYREFLEIGAVLNDVLAHKPSR